MKCGHLVLVVVFLIELVICQEQLWPRANHDVKKSNYINSDGSVPFLGIFCDIESDYKH